MMRMEESVGEQPDYALLLVGCNRIDVYNASYT